MGRLKMEELCHAVREERFGLYDIEMKVKVLLTTQISRKVRNKGGGAAKNAC